MAFGLSSEVSRRYLDLFDWENAHDNATTCTTAGFFCILLETLTLPKTMLLNVATRNGPTMMKHWNKGNPQIATILARIIPYSWLVMLATWKLDDITLLYIIILRKSCSNIWLSTLRLLLWLFSTKSWSMSYLSKNFSRSHCIHRNECPNLWYFKTTSMTTLTNASLTSHRPFSGGTFPSSTLSHRCFYTHIICTFYFQPEMRVLAPWN